MSFNNVTLAMDLSITSPGFAVLAIADDGSPIVLETTHVKTDAKKTHGHRLGKIADEIDRLIGVYDPQHCVREKGFSRFPAVTQTLFKVVGISDYAVASIYEDREIHEIAVTSVKKIVAGSGKASKKDVELATLKHLRIDKEDFFSNDDESDAAAVGLAYYIRDGMVIP